jgi:ribonuclease P protein component
MSKLTLPKKKRLASNRQFKMVIDQGHRMSDRALAIYVAANSCGYPRLGVSVGRSCGDAVVRNRLKRLIREAFRLSQDQIAQSFDYVVMIASAMVRKIHAIESPRAASAVLDLAQVQASFLSLAHAACERALAGHGARPGHSGESSDAERANRGKGG